MQRPQRAAIIGVTGFVGRGLPVLLAGKGMATTGISRSGNGNIPNVDHWQKPDSLDFANHHAVINLAGEPIDQRWTEKSRLLFRESRVGLTHRVVEAIRKAPIDARPKVLVNASAVGIYGNRHDEILSDTAPRGHGYLADLCDDWEKAALAVEELGVRVVCVRIGIVLGRNGSAFEKLRLVLRLGIGGRLGSGKQWMPWIHLDDLRAAIVHAVISENLTGPINGTAPQPETNANLTRKFAAALHRPAIFPAPAFALRLVLGDFASALLAGQRAIPAALEKDGFLFRYPTLQSALVDLTR
ncbi:MAG: TIGR01777 family protein [Akkermansiaceae bacterium]|nr:TIGR01777 family protein [Akkermansiaceae bacterium]